jgi:hypothetical protein
MPVHPYSHYKLATLLDEEEEEDKKKRYHLILSSAAFIPLLRRKRAFASSLITLPGLLEVLIPSLVVGTFGMLSLVIFFSSGNNTSAPMPIIPASAATVSILPMSITQQETYTITAVQGNPNGAANQVFAHTITTTTAPVPKTVNATGQGTTPGTQATGSVLIGNGDLKNPLNLPAGTILTNTQGCTAQGLQVSLDSNVYVPAYSNRGPWPTTTVSIHVVQLGVTGNIQDCSSTDQAFLNLTLTFEAYNLSGGFTGGTDPQTYTVVKQSDIDNAANALISANKPDARQALQGKVQPNERFIGNPQCTPNASPNQSAGDQVSQVTITVSFTCSGEVYDYDGALNLAQYLLKQREQQLHPTYELVGTIITTMQTAKLTDPNSGTVTMTIQTSGTWVAHFDTQSEQALALSIAGKTKSEAQAFLNKQPGIQMASIQLRGGNSDRLPTNPAEIIFTVLPT